MLTNADITIYNRKYNKTTRFDDWNRMVIHDVHFYVEQKTSVSDSGLNSADAYKIRIPEEAQCSKEFISGTDYANKEDVSNNWTIQKGDIVVLGEYMEEIEKPADLTDRGIEYCRINSFSDNRRGGLPHWRIGGF